MAVISSDQITLVNVSDAYSVTLSRESYIFIGNADGVPAGKKCTTEVTAYRGKDQCSAITIAEKQIICPKGISATVSGNSTSKVTVTFTTTATITPPCEATIPITVEGNSFTKQFMFSWIQDPEKLESRLSKAETSISNNADAIKLKASQEEVTKLSDDYKLYTKNTTEFIQTAKGWQLNWEKLISTDDADVENHQDYITFDNGDIILGESSSDLKVKITNDSIQFKGTSETEVTPDKDATAWITGKTFHISNGEIEESLKFGNILMKPTSSGNLAIGDYAEFGSTVRIGNPSSRYTRINSNGLMVNNENTVIAQIGYGTAGDPNGGNSVYAFYTFGERKTGTSSGGYSLIEGHNNAATGFCAHAEGWNSVARIIYRNLRGEGSKFNREGDRNFAVVIPNQELADELIDRGWNVKIKEPRDEGEEPFRYLPVKVKFNDRGPQVYLVSGNAHRELSEDMVSIVDEIDIRSVNLDVRPYDWEVNGKTGRTAYLQSMEVIQEIDRFAARYAEEESPEE